MTDTEKLTAIRQIKQRREPPFDKRDRFDRRYPWKKFGEWCDIFGGMWSWYIDDYLIANTNEKDIQAALRDIELTEGGDAVERS